jgi:hypothetical protein
LNELLKTDTPNNAPKYIIHGDFFPFQFYLLYINYFSSNIYNVTTIIGIPSPENQKVNTKKYYVTSIFTSKRNVFQI